MEQNRISIKICRSLVIFLKLIIIEIQFIEKIILGLCREPKGVINLKLQFCYKVP